MEPSQVPNPQDEPDSERDACAGKDEPLFDPATVNLTNPENPEDFTPEKSIETQCRELMSLSGSALRSKLPEHIALMGEYDNQRGMYSSRPLEWLGDQRLLAYLRSLPPDHKEFIANSVALEIALAETLKRNSHDVLPTLLETLRSDDKARAGILAAILRSDFVDPETIQCCVNLLNTPELCHHALKIIDAAPSLAVSHIDEVLAAYPAEPLWDEFDIDTSVERGIFVSIFGKFERLDAERTWEVVLRQLGNSSGSDQLTAISLVHGMETAPIRARSKLLELVNSESESDKIRSWAIAAVRKHGWSTQLRVPLLMEMARGSEIDSDLMEQALGALAEIGEPHDEIYSLYHSLWRSVEELIMGEDFDSDTPEGVFLRASLLPALALHDARSSDSGRLFRQFLYSPNQELRTMALEAVPKSRVPNIMEELLRTSTGFSGVEDIMVMLDPRAPASVSRGLLVQLRERIQGEMESYDILDQYSAEEMLEKVDSAIRARD
ncbi:MAG: hypothetical protein J0M12_16730 [Deltaproteobacteria bacterium]|nr:hypothetical protein [Deltaproteobacteria bacterium]